MPNDAGSGSTTTEQGPITRSSHEALSKKVVPSTSNPNSELLVKRTPPTLSVSSKSENHKKMKMTTPNPLRRSERTRNHSSSSTSNPSPSHSTNSGSPKHVTAKKLSFEGKDEGNDSRTSSKLKVKKLDARGYRATFKTKIRDYHEESNSTDRSTPEDGRRGGGKIDKGVKGDSLHCKEISKDSTLPSEDDKAKAMSAESRLRGPAKELLENNATLGSTIPSNASNHETSGAPERAQSDLPGEETPQTLASRNSDSNENLIRKCVGHDEAENLSSSKRKSTVVDKRSDISATLVDDKNCNLIVEASPSRLCCNIVETSGPGSKRIRGISLSDVQRDLRKLINNVDQPSSKSNDEKSSARNKGGKSGDSVERPQGSIVETEKIRIQQRSLHLSLKPEITKLCEILLLPDNVKSMVENCLEYTMNNHQICIEPVSLLQAFQLSLCCTVASLLRHKLDLEDSLMLAKRHLNFDCNKAVVDEINARLWDLKDNFLALKGNSKVIGSPKASESSNRAHSNTEVTPEVELTEKDISKNIKETQKRKNKWRKLLQMQQEDKRKLEKDIETEKDDYVRRYKIESAVIRSCSSNDVTRKEKLKVFDSEFHKRIGELERQQKVLLKDLKTKQLEARRNLRESWDIPDSSKELGTSHNAPIILLYDHVAEGNNFDNIDEALLSDENSISPQEKSHGVNGMCMPNGQISEQVHEDDDGNGSNNGVTLNSQLNDERSTDGNLLDREVHVEMPGTVNITPLSMEQISGGAVDVSDLDKALPSPCVTASPSNSPDANAIILLNQPSLEKQNPYGVSSSIPTGQNPVEVSETIHEWATASALGREAAVGMPSTVKSTDYPANAAPMNSPSTDQISDGGLVDWVLSSRLCSSSSPSNGRPVTTSLLNASLKQRVPDRVLATTTDGQIPVTVPENSHEEAGCQLTDNVVVNKSTTSDHQEGDHRTVTENTLSQETPVCRPVDIIEPLEQVQPLLPVESLPSPVDILPANQSNHVSMVMESPEQVQQLPSSGFLFSNRDPCNLPLVTGIEDRAATNGDALSSQIPEASVEVQNQANEQLPSSEFLTSNRDLSNLPLVTGIGDRATTNEDALLSQILEASTEVQIQAGEQLPSSGFLSSNGDLSNLPLVTGVEARAETNEDALSSQIPEASTEVQNEAREQPPLNFEVDSHSCQAVVPPVSSMAFDSLMPGGVRYQSSDIRNLATPRVINNHPMQTAIQSASRIVPPLCRDPLSNELERICKLKEQNMKKHEDMKLQLKCDFEKEREELCRKYDIKYKEIEIEFLEARKNQETILHFVYAHKKLADALVAKSDPKVSGSSLMPQDAGFSQLLFQLSGQQNAIRPSLVAAPSSCGPPGASWQSSYTTTGSQNMAPTIQATYNTSGILSSVSARRPHGNSISLPLGNLQAGGEMRAPAPHLQPFRPPTSIPASGLYTAPHGTPSHVAPAPHLQPYPTPVPASGLYTASHGTPSHLAPAPHLQPHRPPTSVPSSSLYTGPHGTPSHPAPGNSPVSSLSFSQLQHWPAPTASQSDPHRGHWHDNTGGFPSPNIDANSQSRINLPNVWPRMADLASLNPSTSGTSSMAANSAHEATPDVVCLSDDD